MRKSTQMAKPLLPQKLDFSLIRKSLLIVLSSGILFSGCVNSGNEKSPLTASSSSPFNSTNASTTPAAGSGGYITLTRIVRSNTDPNSVLDVIGQNAEIGSQCPNKATSCKCAFRWTEANGIVREAQSDTSLTETDLARCSFSVVTSDVGYFDVRLFIVNANQYSNTIRVYMPSTNPSLDPSLSSNYVPTYRYMCRDIIRKTVNTNFYQNTLLDPNLWDSTPGKELSFIYTLYTTALGLDYGATSSDGGVPGFECPIIPNNTAENAIYDYGIKSLDPVDLTNLNNNGMAPGTGDNTIYPNNDDLNSTLCPTGTEITCEKYNLNRHDFYLSTFKGGVFKEPVCIFHNVQSIASGNLDCTIPTGASGASISVTLTTAGLGKDVVGFAAVPDGNQRCPDASVVKIPSGKKWVKVWQFRTSRDPRKVDDVSNPNDIGDLFCTTREVECKSTGNNLSICMNSRTPTGPRIGAMIGATLGGNLTDPGFGNCNQLGTSGDGQAAYAPAAVGVACYQSSNDNCCRDNGTGAAPPSTRPANFTPGGQWCNPMLIGSHDASSTNVAAPGLGQDVWLMGNGTRRACIEADTDTAGQINNANFAPNPNPYNVTKKQIDSSSKSDIIYVVTPESVTFEQMQDSENGKIARQYTPFRCLDAACISKQQYELFSGSQNTGTALDRLSKFPLCVLQDSRKGATEITP